MVMAGGLFLALFYTHCLTYSDIFWHDKGQDEDASTAFPAAGPSYYSISSYHISSIHSSAFIHVIMKYLVDHSWVPWSIHLGPTDFRWCIAWSILTYWADEFWLIANSWSIWNNMVNLPYFTHTHRPPLESTIAAQLVPMNHPNWWSIHNCGMIGMKSHH